MEVLLSGSFLQAWYTFCLFSPLMFNCFPSVTAHFKAYTKDDDLEYQLRSQKIATTVTYKLADNYKKGKTHSLLWSNFKYQ